MKKPSNPLFALNAATDEHCSGRHICIVGFDEIAAAVAATLLQQYTYAQSIVEGTDPGSITLGFGTPAALAVIKKRKLEVTTNEERYHRDGLIFQILMWLAEKQEDAANGMARPMSPPHVRQADKGQDMLILYRSGTGDVEGLEICEDKATKSPSKTIKSKVVPEIEEYERAERDDELRAGLIDLLRSDANMTDVERERIAAAVQWNKSRRYRVRVTNKREFKKPNRNDLFKPIADLIGDATRRAGDTVQMDVRDWMDSLCARIVSILRAE